MVHRTGGTIIPYGTGGGGAAGEGGRSTLCGGLGVYKNRRNNIMRYALAKKYVAKNVLFLSPGSIPKSTSRRLQRHLGGFIDHMGRRFSVVRVTHSMHETPFLPCNDVPTFE